MGYGRFMQTDPLGYDDGMNWYNHSHSDPVNGSDPSGMFAVTPDYFGSGGGGRWMWDCYGSCGGGYWNTGLSGLGTPTQQKEAREEAAASAAAAKAARPDDGTHPYSRDTYTDPTTKDIVVTATKDIHDSTKWFILDGGYVLNSHYVRPSWDIGLDGIVKIEVGAAALAGAVVTAPVASEALFARGTGALNSNNTLRFGWGWKGSATTGRDVFRMSLGHRSWETIPGLPSFPWHLP